MSYTKDEVLRKLLRTGRIAGQSTDEYLALPGARGHGRDCECIWCDAARHTADLAIERGVWTREEALSRVEGKTSRRVSGEPRGLHSHQEGRGVSRGERERVVSDGVDAGVAGGDPEDEGVSL